MATPLNIHPLSVLEGWRAKTILDTAQHELSYGGSGLRTPSFIAPYPIEIQGAAFGLGYTAPAGNYGEAMQVRVEIWRAGVLVDQRVYALGASAGRAFTLTASDSMFAQALDKIVVKYNYTTLPSNLTYEYHLDVVLIARTSGTIKATGFAGYEGPSPATGFVGSGATYNQTFPAAPSTVTIVPINAQNVGTLSAFANSAEGVGVYSAPTNRMLPAYFYARVTAN